MIFHFVFSSHSLSLRVRSDKWVKQFTVLQGHQLIFYIDHKTKDNVRQSDVDSESLFVLSF